MTRPSDGAPVRAVEAWAPVNASGVIAVDCVRPTAEGAVSRVTDGYPQDWPRLVRDGWRVVRVRVVAGEG